MQASDIVKKREIHFDALPPAQVEQALLLLNGIPNLEATHSTQPNCLCVRYRVTDYTLKGLEHALTAQGFHLDNSLMHKVVRALVYYCEEVQRDNLRFNDEREKKIHEISVCQWDRHPHGDHDDTPAEWREYR